MAPSAHRFAVRRLGAAGVVAGLLLSGCASSSGAGAVPVAPFRSAFAGSRPGAQTLEAQISSEILAPGQGAGAPGLAGRASALALEAEQSLNAVSGLAAPTRDNTRLRDVRSAVGTVLDDLSAVSTAAANHDRAAAAAAIRSLRSDAAALRTAEATLSEMLGLPPGRD